MQNWPLPFVAILATVAIALASPASAGPAPGEITSVDTSGYPNVTVSVPVVDASGQPVTGLTAEHFQVDQNGAPATIESVDAAVDTDIGAGVVVVIDISGSMTGAPIEAAKAAAISFVGSLAPADLVAVVAFSDAVQLIQPFTADKTAATAVIQGLTVFGDTALYEAANQSLDFAQQSGLSRQAIVLLSDGANDDPNGGPPSEFVVARAAELKIPIFAVALGAAADATFTQQLADATGGVAYKANSPAALSSLYTTVAERLNSEYIIRYQAPPGIGEQTITVTADANGAQYTAQAVVDMLWSATSDEDGPTISLPGYEPGSSVAKDLVMSPTVDSDAAITGVTVSIDGTSQQVLATEPYTYTLQPAALTVGRHTLSFEARDNGGRAGRYDVVVEIAEATPSIAMSPSPGAALKAGDPIAIEVLAQGQRADSVTVTFAGEDHVLNDPPFVFEVPAGAGEGSHHLSVAAEVAGQTINTDYDFQLTAGSSSSLTLFVAIGLALAVLAGGYFLWRRRRRRRAAAQGQDYVPGMHAGLEPLVAASSPTEARGQSAGRGLRARLRAIEGPLAGRIFFLGNGSGVIGTSSDATIRIELAGWETAPELVRIWSRDDKYMFHQVAPGNVSISGRETPWAVLESGDEIRIEDHVFVFELPSAQPGPGGLPAVHPAQAQL
jgi:VWFA-related protein